MRVFGYVHFISIGFLHSWRVKIRCLSLFNNLQEIGFGIVKLAEARPKLTHQTVAHIIDDNKQHLASLKGFQTIRRRNKILKDNFFMLMELYPNLMCATTYKDYRRTDYNGLILSQLQHGVDILIQHGINYDTTLAIKCSFEYSNHRDILDHGKNFSFTSTSKDKYAMYISLYGHSAPVFVAANYIETNNY